MTFANTLALPEGTVAPMPWVRFDDQYPIHRKVAGLSDTAFRLHSAAIFWCARNGTDGFVSEEDLDQVCAQVRAPERFAAECVKRGTWHVSGHGCDSEHCPPAREEPGWVIHDYLEYQPTKEEAEAAEKKQREQKSSGGTLGNHRRWHAQRGVFKKDCPWCSPPDPSVSDRYPIGVSDRSAIPPSRPEGSVSVVSHLSPGDARGTDDDDDLISAVTVAVVDATGCVPAGGEARALAAKVLARATRKNIIVHRPPRYVAAAIADEPGMYAELLASRAPAGEPPPRSPLLPWCGKCDQRTRFIENDQGQPSRCPDCHPNAQEAS